MPDRCSAGTAAALALLLSASAALLSCAGLRVPAQRPAPGPEDLRTLTMDGILLGAHPIVGRDAYWDHFDDNLPEIGIAAVWISIRNHRAGTVDLTRCRWSLKTAARRYRALEASQFMDIYYDGRNLRLRSENRDRNTRRELNNIMFRPGSIRNGLTRDGYLFFRLKSEALLDWKKSATLEARNVLLEDGRKIDLILSLSNGNP
jgi:hypothetical protein